MSMPRACRRSRCSAAKALVHVYVDDVESLHRRAANAGADATDLELSPAGDRRFTATDPEGQIWVFAQRVEERR
jgi:uncharacterized glyoxalase superfamily protein PhnB